MKKTIKNNLFVLLAVFLAAFGIISFTTSKQAHASAWRSHTSKRIRGVWGTSRILAAPSPILAFGKKEMVINGGFFGKVKYKKTGKNTAVIKSNHLYDSSKVNTKKPTKVYFKFLPHKRLKLRKIIFSNRKLKKYVNLKGYRVDKPIIFMHSQIPDCF